VPQKNVKIIPGDVKSLTFDVAFDRILADVPCSGTGTLARHPEIKWRLKAEDLKDLQARQLGILGAAVGQLAAGGKLVFSTCSLEREENEDVVEQVLAENAQLDLLPCRPELERLREEGELLWPDISSLLAGPYLRTIPGVHGCDGFFAAILKRK